MNLIVDTNIVFSTLLNPYSPVGAILMNVQDKFTFFAPELLIDELKRYSEKISRYTKLDKQSLSQIQALILSTINFVSEESITNSSWVHAFELTKNVDEDDTPFIALSIELNAKLWTGDKILARGLAAKGADLTITTAEIKKLINNSNSE